MRKRFYSKRPHPIANVFAARGFSAKMKTLVPLYRVQKDWAAIVGAEIAQRTQPLKIERERLLVRVESPSWKMHLEFMKLDILEKVFEATAIRFADLQFVPGNVVVREIPAVAAPAPLPADWVAAPAAGDQSLADVMERMRDKMKFLAREPRS